MQASLISSNTSNICPSSGTISNAKQTFASPVSAFKHTVQNGGYRSLYTGLSLPVAAQAVYKATVLTVNNVTRSLLLDYKINVLKAPPTHQLTSVDSFVCGTIAGAVNALLFVAPVEFVRNQLIEQHSRLAFERDRSESVGTKVRKNMGQTSQTPKNGNNQYNKNPSSTHRSLTSTTMQHPYSKPPISSSIMNGPIDVIQTVIRKNGILGLWRGAAVTVTRDSMGCGFYFLVFELGKHYLGKTSLGENSLATVMFSGSISGVAFWCAALPFDTMKTLVQNGSAKNMSSAITQIGSLRNLFKGWQVAIGKGAPGATVTMGTYEFVRRTLQKLEIGI